MALSRKQYDDIMRQYEITRDENRALSERRREEIYRKIPEYETLDASVGATALAKAQLLLDGDDSAVTSLHDRLADLRKEKADLLREAGYPEDYLDPIYTCHVCQDTGYVTLPNLEREKCSCLRQREISVLYEQSNLREMISGENFSTLSFDYYSGEDLERFQGAVKIARDFVQNFKHDYQNLFFYGTVGTGKSFLSGCIARELLLSGHSVIYFSSAGLFDLLAKYTFDAKEKDNLYLLYEDLYGCDLVIIDDLGTELASSFVASQLFSCLNERQLRKKATVISTNLNLEELRDRYSDRVFSRITSNFTLCKITGPDIRMRRKLSNVHGSQPIQI